MWKQSRIRETSRKLIVVDWQGCLRQKAVVLRKMLKAELAGYVREREEWERTPHFLAWTVDWVIVPFLEDGKARMEYRTYSTLAIMRLRCLLDVQADLDGRRCQQRDQERGRGGTRGTRPERSRSWKKKAFQGGGNRICAIPECDSWKCSHFVRTSGQEQQSSQVTYILTFFQSYEVKLKNSAKKCFLTAL